MYVHTAVHNCSTYVSNFLHVLTTLHYLRLPTTLLCAMQQSIDITCNLCCYSPCWDKQMVRWAPNIRSIDPAPNAVPIIRRLVGVEFNAPFDTIQVISEAVFTANHVTDYRKIQIDKLSTNQKKQTT